MKPTLFAFVTMAAFSCAHRQASSPIAVPEPAADATDTRGTDVRDDGAAQGPAAVADTGGADAREDEGPALAYLVVLKRDPTWEVIPRALLPSGAQGGYWHEATKGRVFFYLVPIGAEGVAGAVRDTYLELQAAGMATEPVHEADDDGWAYFQLSGEFPSGEPARGKVFARKLESMPRFMIIGIGLWPAEHDASMRSEMDYMIATAHMRTVTDGSAE